MACFYWKPDSDVSWLGSFTKLIYCWTFYFTVYFKMLECQLHRLCDILTRMMSEIVWKGKELTYYNMQFSHFYSSIRKIPWKVAVTSGFRLKPKISWIQSINVEHKVNWTILSATYGFSSLFNIKEEIMYNHLSP